MHVIAVGHDCANEKNQHYKYKFTRVIKLFLILTVYALNSST
jgi:hypothetical protein